jgi:glycosyltransferase involved in cell wall biosynthesis
MPSSKLCSAAPSPREESARKSRQEALISVVVPTRDRPDALRRCLDALSAQTVLDRLEVVVVDDGSHAADEVAAASAGHAHVRLIRRAGGGPAAARNAGARAARGAFLCFTDDDCVPRPDWADRLVDTLRKGADAAAGTTSLSRAGALAEALDLVAHALDVPQQAGSDLAFAASNNIACTRTAFEATPFDESYSGAAGEDRDWCARLTAGGFALRSAPDACVVHDQPLTLLSFLGQQVRYGQGAFQFRHGSDRRRPLESPSFYASLVRRAFANGFSVGLLFSAAQAATAAGFGRAWIAAGRKRLLLKRDPELAASTSRGKGP